MTSSLLATFLGAIQASCSVLLVIIYGILAAKLNILDRPSTKKISTLCVQILLPALLVTKLGNELQYETATQYGPVLGWALIYNLASIGFGISVVKSFKLPPWITVAIAFNNTTSLPLLLIKSLESTGILKRLLVQGDTTAAAVARAQSYFLVCSIVGNCLTFAIGPHLLQQARPDQDDSKSPGDCARTPAPCASDISQEQSPLLPHSALDLSTSRHSALTSKQFLSITKDLVNAPTIGALIGLFIGVTPPLHRAFFSPQSAGGIFTPWLTASLQSTGQAFVALQVLIVGVTLATPSSPHVHSSSPASTLDDVSSTPAGSRTASYTPTLLVLASRFLIWPSLSLLIIYSLATYTDILQSDPILWFSMMLMPAGPPAMKLVAMAEVSHAPEAAKRAVARTLAVSYVCVPLLSLGVAAAVRLVESAMVKRGLGR